MAFVSRRQPCTAYKIRQSFQKSTATRFSNSAGSIYPLVRRLAARNYLVETKTEGDGRGACTYRVSAKGLRKVRSWICDISDPEEIGVYDPIRSRLTNISLLSESEQMDWLDRMIEILKGQQDLIRTYEAQPFVGDNRLFEIARESLWRENELRIQSLTEARDMLTGARRVS
ncbi:MAG: PadR family transcriptional regulator [Woeseiaceae bacterium]|nr:PadR family transcriptional regulator [Woeseiaceae bacterium]